MTDALRLLAIELERELHVLGEEPWVLVSHLHNVLLLDEGEAGPGGVLLAGARAAMAGRPWLRLTNRPVVARSALVRVIQQGGSLAWSRDGGILAWAGRSVGLWDRSAGRESLAEASGDLLTPDRDEGAEMTTALWSPDGRHLATSAGATVHVFSCTPGGDGVAPRLELDGVFTLAVYEGTETRAFFPWATIAWLEDGRRLAWGSHLGLRVWDVAAETPRPVGVGSVYEPRGTLALACREDTACLAWGDEDGLTVWEAAAGDPEVIFQHPGNIRSVAWTSLADRLAWGTDDDGLVRVWEAPAGQPLTVVEAHGQPPIEALAWSPGGTLASAGLGPHRPTGGRPRMVYVWDISSPGSDPVLALEGEGPPLIWSPDGALLATGGKVWDTSSPGSDPVLALEGRAPPLAWSPDGGLLAALSGGTLSIWSRAGSGSRPPKLLQGASGPITWSPDGALLATGGPEDIGTIRIWDPEAATDTAAPPVREGVTGGIAWRPDGSLLATVGRDMVHLLDGVAGTPVGTLEGAAWPVAWSIDGSQLAAGVHPERAGAVGVWDVGSRERVGPPFQAPSAGISALAWSPDGRFLAAGGHGVHIWATGTWTPGPTLPGPSRAGGGHTALALAWSPDGRRLAWATPPAGWRVWNPSEESPGPVLGAERGTVAVLAWSPDGALLATGGADGAVWLWDPVTGAPQPVSLNHRGRVRALAWSPDGRLLASGGNDGSVRLTDPSRPGIDVVARTLSPVAAVGFAEEGRVLLAADTGSATGHRPIPYRFELAGLAPEER